MGLGSGRQFEGAVKPSSIEVDSYEADLFAHRYTEIPTTLQQRLDYGSRTDGQPDYMGYGARGLTTTDSGWLIHKFTYNATGGMTLRQSAFGIWDNRASLNYA